MAYGTIKVDTITFTDGGVDKSVSVSGLVENPTFTGNVTATGTISGDIVRGQTISGVTVTGTTAQFTSGTFTSLTGVTVTGTTANFTSGNFTNISGGTHTITSGVFALGTAANPSISFTSDPNTGIYSPGADQVAISTNGTGRLFVDASGNIGLGTSAPNVRLDVAGTARIGTLGSVDFTLDLGRSGVGTTRSAFLNGNSGNVTFSNQENGFLSFHTNNTERLRLDSSGRLGLGTSSPTEQLSVAGGNVSLHTASSRSTERRLLRYDTSSVNGMAAIGMNGAGTNGFLGEIKFYTSNSDFFDGTLATRMIIDSSGRVGIGTTSPSETLHVAGSIRVGTTSDYVYANNLGQISSSLPLALVSNSETVFKTTSNQERARIDSSGRLLVGTSSSSSEAKLLVQGGSTGSGAALHLQRNVTTASAGSTIGYLRFANSADNAGATIVAEGDGTWTAGTSHPTSLVFSVTRDGQSSPTERMRITRTGETYVFCASGAWNHSANNASDAGTVSALYQGRHSATDNTGTTGTRSYVVWTNGNVQNTNNSYTAISDIKLKENIVNANSQWDDIKALQVRNYNLKEGQTHRQIGLIAQEVEPISPGLVYESPDRDAEGNDLGTMTKSVNYSVLYMKAVKALQEAMERIETLEAKVAALEVV